MGSIVIDTFTLRACLLLGAAMTAFAQSKQENVEKCKSPDSDPKIIGCTALIQTGQLTTDEKIVAFVNRGTAYYSKGDYDRAIQDYDQAIQLNPRAGIFVARGDAYKKK